MSVVSFTGHRPDKLGGYGNRQQVEDFAKSVIGAMVSIGTLDKAIVGMALGWDQAVAVACIHHRVPFIAAVPFNGHHYRWPIRSQKRYEALLEQAAETVVVSSGRPEEPWEATTMLHERDHWMVDRSERLCALWNSDKAGGTFKTVKYAEKVGKPVANVWGIWEQHQVLGDLV